jgi:hypothetical protein
MQDAEQLLRDELEKLREEAAGRARGWSELARRRRRLHYGIGIPAVALASLAGAAALSDLSRVLAGICALGAAVLTSLQTFLRPDASAIWATEQAVGWREIDDDARLLLDVDFPALTSEQRRERFDGLRLRARALQREVVDKSRTGTEPAR